MKPYIGENKARGFKIWTQEEYLIKRIGLLLKNAKRTLKKAARQFGKKEILDSLNNQI